MHIQTLSDNMKRVLCGISLYPEESTNNLAKKISINTSTVSTYKQRIQDRELIQTKYIPEFFNIDLGAIVIISGNYRYKFPAEMRKSIINIVTYPSIPFFTISDNTAFSIITYLPLNNLFNYEERSVFTYDKSLNEMIFNLKKIWFLTEDTTVEKYFDFHSLFSKLFNVYLPKENSDNYRRWSIDKLKNNDKKVMHNLIHKPGLSDFHRSQILGISHPSIKRLRINLTKNGLIKKIVIPNLDPFELSIVSWCKIDLEGKNVDTKVLTTICNYPNNVLSVYDVDNMFIISIYKNFKDMSEEKKKMDELLSDISISYDEIETNNFSVENQNFTFELDPLPSTLSMLEMYKEIDDKQILNDPESYIAHIFDKVLSENEVSTVMGDVYEILETECTNKDPVEGMRTVLLKLLTEPKLLNNIKKNKKIKLQEIIIDNLNKIQLKMYTQIDTTDEERRLKVMFIEDSTAEIKLLRDMLCETKFSLIGNAENGQEGYALYRELCEKHERPDVILVDTFIDGFNVNEATKMIKDYDPSAYIIAFTSLLDYSEKEKIISSGVDKYISKPITKPHLVCALKKSLLKNN